MQITGVSCPTASRCVAVDNNGDVLTSTDPTGGPAPGTSKTSSPSVRPRNGRPAAAKRAVLGASCASTTRSAPWSASTAASSPRPIRSRPPTDPARRRKAPPATTHDPRLRRELLESQPHSPPPHPRPLSLLLADQDQRVRMQARPAALPPLSLAAALLGGARAARPACARDRADRTARPGGDQALPRSVAAPFGEKLRSGGFDERCRHPFGLHRDLPAGPAAPSRPAPDAEGGRRLAALSSSIGPSPSPRPGSSTGRATDAFLISTSRYGFERLPVIWGSPSWLARPRRDQVSVHGRSLLGAADAGPQPRSAPGLVDVPAGAGRALWPDRVVLGAPSGAAQGPDSDLADLERGERSPLRRGFGPRLRRPAARLGAGDPLGRSRTPGSSSAASTRRRG